MHIENLKQGEYLAVIDVVHPDGYDDGYGRAMHIITTKFTGEPLQVSEISPPFILFQRLDGTYHSFDYRRYNFTKISKAFVARYKEKAIIDSKHRVSLGNQFFGQSSNPLIMQPDPPQIDMPRNPCPRCQGPMEYQMTMGKDGWFFVCKECGLEVEDK